MSVLSTAAIQAEIAAVVVKINNWIKTNGNREITGAQENEVFNDLASVLVDISDSYANLTTNGPLIYKGTINCSANPNYPAADAGHVYVVSAAGKIGGASGIDVEVGDMLLCKVNGSASGNQATVGANWDILQFNIDYVPENVSNKDNDEALAADSNVKYPTQHAVKAYADGLAGKVLVFTYDWQKMGPPSGSSGSDAIVSILKNTTGATWTLIYNTSTNCLELTASIPAFPAVTISGSSSTNAKLHIEAFEYSSGSFAGLDLVTYGYKLERKDDSTAWIKTKVDGANADYDWINRIDLGPKIITLEIFP